MSACLAQRHHHHVPSILFVCHILYDLYLAITYYLAQKISFTFFPPSLRCDCWLQGKMVMGFTLPDHLPCIYQRSWPSEIKWSDNRDLLAKIPQLLCPVQCLDIFLVLPYSHLTCRRLKNPRSHSGQFMWRVLKSVKQEYYPELVRDVWIRKILKRFSRQVPKCTFTTRFTGLNVFLYQKASAGEIGREWMTVQFPNWTG